MFIHDISLITSSIQVYEVFQVLQVASLWSHQQKYLSPPNSAYFSGNPRPSSWDLSFEVEI